MKLYRQAGNIKAALFAGAIVLVTGLLFYTDSIIEDLRTESREIVSLYAQLIAKGVTEATDTELDFVFREIIQKVRFPIIYSDGNGVPVNWRNLPGNGDLEISSVRRLMNEMDRLEDPIPLTVTLPSSESRQAREMVLGHLHYGDSHLIRKLRILPYVEIGAVGVFIFLGFVGFQVIRKNEKQHIWFGMARETAHQLGTPVSSLLGWVARLRDHPGESDRVADQMTADIGRLQQISDRFARMGSSPEEERVDIRKILTETVEYFRRRLPQTGKEMTLQLDEGDPIYVRGTPTLLSWALENVLKNAIDSIDKPQGRIFLRTALKGNVAVVLIQDSGRGIPRRDWKNIFRPGYSTKEHGWGLGLSLTKRIIKEFQNGTIRVRSSEVGKGTVFEVRLPAYVPPAGGHATAQSGEGALGGGKE
ncbi:MAG: PAS domain-containing sensor histidine kinase [Fidelibacterota bacterium]